MKAPEWAPDLLHRAARASRSERKSAECGAFAEPSDGLEPSTPSLPSKLGGLPLVAGDCRGLRAVATALLHNCSTICLQEWRGDGRSCEGAASDASLASNRFLVPAVRMEDQSIRGNPWKRTRVQAVAAARIVTVSGVPPVVCAWRSGVRR